MKFEHISPLLYCFAAPAARQKINGGTRLMVFVDLSRKDIFIRTNQSSKKSFVENFLLFLFPEKSGIVNKSSPRMRCRV